MGKKYIKSIEKPDKFEDFKAFAKQYPHLTTQQLAGAYGVSTGTTRGWLRKIKKEQQ